MLLESRISGNSRSGPVGQLGKSKESGVSKSYLMGLREGWDRFMNSLGSESLHSWVSADEERRTRGEKGGGLIYLGSFVSLRNR